MSNDPSGYSDVPPEPPHRPPDLFGETPGLPGPNLDFVRNRVQGPAIGLIIVGVVNLLLALVAGGFGAIYARTPPEIFEEVLEKQQPANMNQLKQSGITVRGLLQFYTYGGFGEGALGLLTAILAVVAGARMLALRSYGLAVFTSVLVAIPCISCSGCCGLGEGIGIWALVVLLNEEVKMAFR
jgi:hypothetical protein